MDKFPIQKWSSLLVVGVSVAAVGACTQGSNQDLVGSCPSGAAVDLNPGKQVIEQKCNSCHSFDPDNLSGSVFATIDDGSMPPAGPLSATETEQVRVLIACTTGGGVVTTQGAEGGAAGD